MTPTEVIVGFQREVVEAVRDYKELLLAIHQKRREDGLTSKLSEQLARSVTLLWETFLHDLLVASITENPTQLLDDLGRRVTQSATERFGSEVAGRISFDSTAPSRASAVRNLLDPKGFNLTFRSADELSRKANQFLPPAIAIKFSLDQSETEFLVLCVALRNYLSHKSSSSLDSLKNACNLSAPANSVFLYSPPFNVHAYLKSTVLAENERRVVLIARRMYEQAARFA